MSDSSFKDHAASQPAESVERLARGHDRRDFLKSVGAVAGTAFLGALQPGCGLLSAETQKPCPSPGLVRFGSSDLCVSRYCQGTAFRKLPRTDNPEARKVLQRCLDVGINFFDSSEAYGWGGSEQVLGKVIAGRRDKVVVCTKVTPSHPPSNDPDPSKYKVGDSLPLSREVLLQKVEGSLKNLGTDYIDLYLVHNPDEVTPAVDIADSMTALVRAGKIRYWGVSNHKPERVVEFHELGKKAGRAPFVGIEDSYNISMRERLEPEMFEVISRTGIGLMAFSPQDTGKLSSGAVPEAKMVPLVQAMDKVASELGATRSQICIAWVLTHPQVSSVLGGAESPEHVEENFRGTLLKLPPSALATLNAASDAHRQSKLGPKK